MTSIFNVLQNLVDILLGLVDFIIGFFQDLVYVATLLPGLIQQATTLITTFIPGEALSIVIAMLTLTVVYKILGRD